MYTSFLYAKKIIYQYGIKIEIKYLWNWISGVLYILWW